MYFRNCNRLLSRGPAVIVVCLAAVVANFLDKKTVHNFLIFQVSFFFIRLIWLQTWVLFPRKTVTCRRLQVPLCGLVELWPLISKLRKLRCRIRAIVKTSINIETYWLLGYVTQQLSKTEKLYCTKTAKLFEEVHANSDDDVELVLKLLIFWAAAQPNPFNRHRAFDALTGRYGTVRKVGQQHHKKVLIPGYQGPEMMAKFFNHQQAEYAERWLGQRIFPVEAISNIVLENSVKESAWKSACSPCQRKPGNELDLQSLEI